MTATNVLPARNRIRRVFGLNIPFLTQGAKETRQRGERASKPAIDETKAIQAGRGGVVALIFLRNNNRRDTKDGRKANLKRIYRERH